LAFLLCFELSTQFDEFRTLLHDFSSVLTTSL
jgi:hypothetical protein